MVKNDKNHHADHKVKAAERNARREAAALRSSSTTAHEEPASSVSMIADNSIITTSTTTQPSSVGGGSNEQQNTSNPSSGSLSNTRPSKHRVKASERNSARREKATSRSLTPPKRISPNRTTGRSLTPPGLDRKHYYQQRHERRKERGGPTATAASTTRRSAGSTTTNPSGDIHASLNDEHDNYNNEEEKEEYDDFSHAFEPGAVRVRFTDTEEGNDDDDGDVDNIDDMVKDMESQLQLNQQPIASVVAAEVAEDIDTLQKQKEQLQRELESIRQKQQGQRKSDVTTVAVEAKIVNTLPTTEENENNNIFKKRVACCCVVVVLIIIVGLIIEVVLSELENDDSDEPTGAPTGEEVNTFPPSRENPEGDVYITTKKELLIRDMLEPVYGVIYAPSNSPQRFALEWLKSNADDDELILATNTTTTTTNTTNTTGVDAVITQSLVQHYALLVLYDATDGEHWTPSYAIVVEGLDRSGCNVNDNMPVGILCDENDIVRRMHLPNNNLRGTIPTEIGALSTLFELDLEENLVVGTIPTEIGNLSNLEILELQENSFEGNVPSEIGKISKLESLYLSDNSLTGSVPSSLSMLTNLYIVHLQRNIGLTAGVNEAFCNGDNTALLQLRADCIENEEICTCCTECCDSTQCCSTTDVGYCFNL